MNIIDVKLNCGDDKEKLILTMVEASSLLLGLNEDVPLKLIQMNPSLPQRCIAGMWPRDCDKPYYTIALRPYIELDELVDSVIHESVHIRQYHTGQLLLDSATEDRIWGGLSYPTSMIRAYSYVEELYKSLPWEEEAYRLSEEYTPKVKHLLRL